MKNKTARTKLIYILLFFSLALLIANIIQVSENIDDVNTPPYPTVKEIEHIFEKTLFGFSLNEDWIKKFDLGRNSTDSLKYYFQIYLPYEISTVEFISAINKKCGNEYLSIVSEEYKINGSCELKIFSGGLLKLNARVLRKKELNRSMGAFAFVLEELDQLTEIEIIQILENPFLFSILLIPSKENLDFKNIIQSYGKGHCIYLGDDIAEEIYELDEDFPKRRLRNSIINIVNNFGGASHFFIDKNSAIYKSTSYNFIIEEFAKRGKTITTLAGIKRMEADSNEDLFSLFDFYYGSLGNKGNTLFFINCSDYKIIQKKIEESVMKGLKIIKPSEL